MNAEQLIQALQTFGLEPETDYGHVVCLLDCWTGRIMSAILHPGDPSEGRQMTIIISSSVMEAAQGKLLAGAGPTVVGNAWDSWVEVAERAMPAATMVSVSYISKFYDSIGFSLDKFVNGPGKDMTEDQRHAHLNSRLEYAVSRHYVNMAASLAMDVTDTEARVNMLAGFDKGYEMLDQAEKMLSEVDGQ